MTDARVFGHAFTEVFDIPRLTKLCETFSEINDTVVALLDLNGKVHISIAWQDLCTRFHRVNSVTSARCTESDTALASNVAAGKDYNIYFCKNGLVDVAVPVMVGETHVANFFTGQFFFEKPDIERFRQQAEDNAFDQDAYMEALSRVPIKDEVETQKVVKFLVELAQVIGEMGLDRLHLLEQQRSERMRLERAVTARTFDLELKKREQEKLFAIIGHEIRTPAAVLQMLINDVCRKQEIEKADVLKETSAHLLNVLDDMRAVTRSDLAVTGKIETASIAEALNSALHIEERLFKDHGLQVHLDLDEACRKPVSFNVQILRQIAMNLAKNCAIHADASDLWVSAVCTDRTAGTYQVCFADNGKGIRPEDLEGLFKEFTRGDTRADGTGLGLHLSRQFARDMLSGDLTFEPREGGGAVFRLQLKVEPIRETDDSTEPGLENALSGQRILFAEDVELIRELTRDLLEDEGASVVAVEDGEQALEASKQEDFDIVLTDFFMPGMDGCELTRKLRAEGFTNPVIGITAATVGDEESQLLQAGVAAVLDKPVDIDRLVHLVQQCQAGDIDATGQSQQILQSAVRQDAANKANRIIATDRMNPSSLH